MWKEDAMAMAMVPPECEAKEKCNTQKSPMSKEEAMAMAMMPAERAAEESARIGKGKFVPQTGLSLCPARLW